MFDEEGDGDEDREEEHASQSPEVQGAASLPLDEQNGDDGHHHHHHSHPHGGVLGVLQRQLGVLEYVGRVVEHLETAADLKPISGHCYFDSECFWKEKITKTSKQLYFAPKILRTYSSKLIVHSVNILMVQ